jgi:ribonuclease Z
MSRETKKQLGIWGVLGIGFLLGYVAACSRTEPTDRAEVQAQVETGEEADSETSAPSEWSRTQPHPKQEVYYPGTEALGPDEMRVVCCGSGMPQPRLKQAAACFLVELGNGEKFLFDMGAGSNERISALGIPLDQLDKVFLGHLHLDHAGDFPMFYFTRSVNNGLSGLGVWGPSGVRPEWGTKAWIENMKKMWAWEEATRGGAVDPRGLALEVNEFDWKAVNAVIYDENDVVVRSLPAIHGDQSVSFILEWNGFKFAFSSDTLPNKWWMEHTKGCDLSIHESVLPPQFFVEKYDFTPSEAVFVGTQGHTTPAAFGKVMSMTKPRMAVAYHFQNDHDTAPAVEQAIRTTYDGPLSLATDFMVWNITKDNIRTRMAVPNHESYPPPIQRTKQPPDSMNSYQWDAFSFSGVERETAAVTNKIVDEFNQKYGTNVKPSLTGLPFQDEK